MRRNRPPSQKSIRYTLRRRLHSVREIASFHHHSHNPHPHVDLTDAAQGVVAAPIDNLADEVEALRETVVRQRAEFENFRKRTQREKDQIRELASETLLSRLLPVLDNLDRAITSAESAVDIESVRQGVLMIAAQLNRALEAEGLQQIRPLNAQFNPAEHDALAAEERDDVPENHICAVLLPGYTYKDRLLRPAMVKVARRPA